MVQQEQLEQWKQEWRRLVAENLSQALDAIEEHLPAYSPKSSAPIALRGRLNEANRNRILGVLSNDGLQLEYNRIRLALLELIDSLTLTDFQPQPLGSSQGRQRGTLLYKIPARMKLGEETACIIRLAHDELAVIKNIELTDDVEIKQVTVSKVMHAALIDPNEEPAFAIRTFSDEEQFLQKGEYTEWSYYVKPLREGTFSLLLKISVVEKVEGEDRRRNLSWEEKVQIVTEEVREEPAFQPAGIVESNRPVIRVTTKKPEQGSQPIRPKITVKKRGKETSQDVPYSPRMNIPQLDEMMKARPVSPPSPGSSPKPQAPSPAARRGINIRRLSIAATVLIVVGVALFQLQLFTGEGAAPTDVRTPSPVIIDKEWEEAKAEESPGALEDFIEKHPDSEQAEDALWELARRSADKADYQKYLEQYPEGKYVEEARNRLSE